MLFGANYNRTYLTTLPATSSEWTPGGGLPYRFLARSLVIEQSHASLETKSQPTWTDVKAKLASFDRTGLLA
jgi:hypothetical protein